jgi:hypothetical protein
MHHSLSSMLLPLCFNVLIELSKQKSYGASTQKEQLGVLIPTTLHDKHISLTDYDDKTQSLFFFFYFSFL